jgi:hypothetical protein
MTHTVSAIPPPAPAVPGYSYFNPPLAPFLPCPGRRIYKRWQWRYMDNPAEIDKGDLARDYIARVKPDGTTGGRYKPSSELPVHRFSYERRRVCGRCCMPIRPRWSRSAWRGKSRTPVSSQARALRLTPAASAIPSFRGGRRNYRLRYSAGDIPSCFLKSVKKWVLPA